MENIQREWPSFGNGRAARMIAPVDVWVARAACLPVDAIRRNGPNTMSEPLERFLNEQVVLDTGTPILYIGTLREITDSSFVLDEADMHDCRDGHASKEKYLLDAFRDGVSVNRRTVVVMRSIVISVSKLADVVVE